MATGFVSEEIFLKTFILSYGRHTLIFLCLTYFSFKIFNIFLDKVINIVLVEENKSMDILYKRKFQSLLTSTRNKLFKMLVNFGMCMDF